MKNLLIIAGVGFLVYHYMNCKVTPQSNPQVDTAGVPAMSSVAASVPLPGTSTVGVTGASRVPVANSAGSNPSNVGGAYGGPASLGSDLPMQSGSSSVISPSSITHAFERGDYVSHSQFLNNRMMER